MIDSKQGGKSEGGVAPFRKIFWGYVFSKMRIIDKSFLICYVVCMAYKLSLSDADRNFFRSCGRRGGLKRNSRKGFGTGDNARKAALARWAKRKKAN